MKFCRKFYGSLEFQIVLLGLLLPLSVNGVESNCQYFQNVESGKIYYAYNNEYPYNYSGENNCIWQAASSSIIEVACSIKMGNYCNKESLTIQFDNDMYKDCGYNDFVVEGKNPVIKFESKSDSQGGKFLCRITAQDNCKCGQKKETRIVGGEETGINEYPMMCGFIDPIDLDQSFENRIKLNIFCGCTIISNRYVVTAVHCLEGRSTSDTAVVVGEHDVTTDAETDATKVYRLKGCKFHPEYNGNDNDIAICQTDDPIEFSAEVGPACLPFQHSQDSFDNNVVTLLGWGLKEFGDSKSDTLQEVKVNVIDYGTCQRYYSNIKKSNLCTYAPKKDACQMDSGGPVLWEDPNTGNLVLIGIIAGGTGCAADAPGISTRVGSYMDWIQSVTPDTSYCRVE